MRQTDIGEESTESRKYKPKLISFALEITDIRYSGSQKSIKKVSHG